MALKWQKSQDVEPKMESKAFLKHGTWKENIEYVMHCRRYFSFPSLVMTCQVSKDTVPRMNVLRVTAGDWGWDIESRVSVEVCYLFLCPYQ